MPTELAKAYVQIIPSAKGIQGKLAKVMGGEAETAGASSGASFAGVFKKAIAAAGIGIAVKKVFRDAFANGGELQQNLGGTEAVFGRFADTIQSKATTAYKNMGMSASDYMATANKMGSLFQGSGIEQQRALNLTSQAMQRATDVASVMGLDTASAMESIAGAAKGNFTMMDNLGVAMNATTLQAYALEKGINFEWNTASNAEKAELAMKMFMDRTSQYAGNFAKESETTWSGSIGAMKASYQDLMANIMLGNDIAPSLEALGGTIKTFTVNNLMPAIANILQGLPTALVTMLTGVGPEVAMAAANLIAQLGQGVVQSVPKMADSAGKLMDNFILFLNAKMPALLNRGVFVVTNIVNGILSGLPKLIVAGSNAVAKFTTGIMQFLPKVMQAGVNLILKLVQGIIKNLPQIASAALSAITKFISAIGKNLPRIIQSGIEITAKLAAGLIKAIPELVSKIPKIVRAITTEISSVDWWGIGKNIIDGIAKGLANAGHMLWDAVKSVLGNFKSKVLSFFGIHSPSRWGEYVGKMIALGPPKGVEQNLNPFRSAMDKLGEAASNPMENILFRRSNPTWNSSENAGISSKLDRLIELLLMILDRDPEGKEINIYLKDREIIRALKELGVVFE